ncbi:recombinase family protein [Mycolicibacterium neoaurum]|uniref:recombinase family protein n=1 Tax=Mycolicibacterium neoaurum TaxID=1795 RepID=UPI001F4D0325|nr:recombinase family protein [Mycolicibacterium neoaurum]
MRVAIYLRQSLDQTGLQAAVTRQRQEVTALCRERGWDWVEFADNDTSAYNLRKPRPNYQAMLDAVRAGDVAGIVCWHPDRLYRRLEDLTELIDVCQAQDILIETVRGGNIDLTTPMGRMVARMMGTVSMAEMEQKSDRQKAMHRQRSRDGRHWWTHRPFGFIKADGVKDGSGAQLHPVEAPLVKDAYEKALAGVSLYSIMKDWNERGIKSSKGYAWKDARLRDLLLNPRNAGLRDHNGEEIGEADWPAIVSPEVYYAVRSILTDPARNVAGVARARTALLSGIVHCGKCDSTLKSATTRNGVKIYQCKSCYGIGRSQQPFDDAICGLIVHRMSQDDGIEAAQESSRADIAELRVQLRALSERKKEAAAMFAKGTIAGGQLEDINMSIDGDMHSIEARMFDAGTVELFAGYREAFYGADGDVAEWFYSRPLDQRRRIIDSLAKITFKVVEGRKPFTGGNPEEFISVEWKNIGAS